MRARSYVKEICPPLQQLFDLALDGRDVPFLHGRIAAADEAPKGGTHVIRALLRYGV